MRNKSKISAIIIFLLWTVFMVQWVWKPLPVGKLSGQTQEPAWPEMQMEQILHSKWQKQVEHWLRVHFPWRSVWIRSYNQIRYSLFKEFNPNVANPLLEGQNGWLYEKQYVDYLQTAHQTHWADSARLQLKYLAALAQHYEKELWVIVSPAKSFIYPEKLGFEPVKNQVLTEIIRSCDSLGIYCFNAPEVFANWKSQSTINDSLDQLFPRGGTHWSYHAAFRVMDTLYKVKLPEDKGIAFPALDVLSWKKSPPRETDRDLADLSNLWNSSVFAEPIAFPVWKEIKKGELPSVLMVGSSFLWTLVRHMQQGPSFKNLDFLYYNQTLYRYPQNTHFDCRGQTKEPQCNRKKLAEQADIWLFEVNETVLNSFGWNFRLE